MQSKVYGTWDMPVGYSIPEVGADHILGAHLQCDTQGRPDWVDIQFRTPNGTNSLRMDYLNALALLSMLKAIQLDCGTPFPDDPRG